MYSFYGDLNTSPSIRVNLRGRVLSVLFAKWPITIKFFSAVAGQIGELDKVTTGYIYSGEYFDYVVITAASGFPNGIIGVAIGSGEVIVPQNQYYGAKTSGFLFYYFKVNGTPASQKYFCPYITNTQQYAIKLKLLSATLTTNKPGLVSSPLSITGVFSTPSVDESIPTGYTVNSNTQWRDLDGSNFSPPLMIRSFLSVTSGVSLSLFNPIIKTTETSLEEIDEFFIMPGNGIHFISDDAPNYLTLNEYVAYNIKFISERASP